MAVRTILVGLSLLVTPALAADPAGTSPLDNPYQALVEQRQAVQTRWPGDMKAIATWLENPAVFSVSALTGAGIMKGIAGQMTGLYPPETSPDSGNVSSTKASSAIWDDPDRFKELADALAEAADAMLTGIQSQDADAVRTAHEAAQAACDACHAEFVVSE